MFASIKGRAGSGSPRGAVAAKDVQQENAELFRLLNEANPAAMQNPRTKELILQKAKFHAQQRKAMVDIVDTRTERLASMIHGNKIGNVLESKMKAGVLSAAERVAGILESNMLWGQVWKARGQKMLCTRVDPPREIQVEFGRSLRLLYFELEENFLNAASYGATPRPVMDARTQWDLLNQQNPVKFRFKTLPLRLLEVERRLAAEFNADPTDLKLVMNANAATSSILKGLPWEVGDRMLIFDIDYDATKNATQWLRRTKGVEIVEVKLDLPMSDDEVLAAVSAELDRMASSNPPMPKVANFCHVTSKSAWIFPAKKLTKLFHKHGISVIIDGAQAAGHLELDMADIGADWYLGTVHKWLYSCQGVAFLVTQPHKHAVTTPLTVSYFDGEGYPKEFSYTGLQDFSTWCSVLDAFDFIEKVLGGMPAVREYCRAQAQRCCRILGDAWGTEPFQGDSAHYGNMPIMPLPNGRNSENADAAKVMGYLMTKHNITAFLLVYPIKGVPTLCIRCTCQIYTDDDDWRRLAAAVKQLGGKYGALSILADLGFKPGGGSDPIQEVCGGGV
eukprot:Rhum_TRINITY_DN14788_c34_g1::Rhum_TRINITY_DN14788_c34_g1_i1::g.119271::m.119271